MTIQADSAAKRGHLLPFATQPILHERNLHNLLDCLHLAGLVLTVRQQSRHIDVLSLVQLYGQTQLGIKTKDALLYCTNGYPPVSGSQWLSKHLKANFQDPHLWHCNLLHDGHVYNLSRIEPKRIITFSYHEKSLTWHDRGEKVAKPRKKTTQTYPNHLEQPE